MSTAVAIQERPTRSVLVDMSTRFGMEPAAFEATIRATVCKGNVSREEFAAFLLVAKEYGLNPLTKELYAFPAKGGGIQPIVSIDGWSRIINDHPQFDGMEFVDTREGGELVAVTCRMYRKDRTRPIEATEYMSECRRNTDVWKQWPARMLRHKAMIQAARYSFGFSGIIEPDEYDRQTSAPVQQVRRLHDGFEDAAPEPPRALDAPLHDITTGEIIDAEVSEVVDDFPGDRPVETAQEPRQEGEAPTSGVNTASQVLTTLSARLQAFRTQVSKAPSTREMQALWSRSAQLRNDIDAGDPEEVGTSAELETWFQETYAVKEAEERAERSKGGA